jgi:hypothetical protein
MIEKGDFQQFFFCWMECCGFGSRSIILGPKFRFSTDWRNMSSAFESLITSAIYDPSTFISTSLAFYVIPQCRPTESSQASSHIGRPSKRPLPSFPFFSLPPPQPP